MSDSRQLLVSSTLFLSFMAFEFLRAVNKKAFNREKILTYEKKKGFKERKKDTISLMRCEFRLKSREFNGRPTIAMRPING